MSYYRFQAGLNKKNSGKKNLELYAGLVFIAVGVLLLYFLIFYDKSGAVGRTSARVLFHLLGKCSFMAAAFIGYEGVRLLKMMDFKKWRLDFLLGLCGFAVLCGIVSFGNVIFPNLMDNYGGLVGKNVAEFFRRLFGVGVGLAFAVGIFLYILSVVWKFSFADLFERVYEVIKRDIDEYRKVKALSKKIAGRPAVKKPVAERPVPAESASAKTDKKAEPVAVPVTRAASPPKTTSVSVETPARPAISEYKDYKLPPVEILAAPQVSKEEEKHHIDIDRAKVLQQTLADFGIKAEVGDIIPGPVVTRYDLNLDAGIKYQSVTALTENLALALKASSIRIVPIPEKSAVGIEVPNPVTKIVTLREIATSDEFQRSESPLTFALGQTTDGSPFVTDIIPMPHLLIAGATGTGKSVCIHSFILSILLKARPDEVKFMLIDPKRLELPIYEGLPHLYDPSVPPEEVRIITQPKRAMVALKQLVNIMEKRYELFAKYTVRNIDGFNEKALSEPQLNLKPVHYIVVIIDELADLMLISRKEIEDDIQRLAQMARAVGIHLVLATQRPSVDVITGVIKANFSARIAFQTTSKVDSRVILDTIGAEDLLGRGDMLYLPPGAPKPVRLQGTFASSKDAENVVKFIQSQGYKPSYDEYNRRGSAESPDQRQKDEKEKEYIISALKLIIERRRVSQDLLKAHFGSSATATNVLSLLERDGFIFKPEGTNKWSIMFTQIQEFLEKEKTHSE